MYKETTNALVKIFLFFKRRYGTTFYANLTKTYISLLLHIINTENYFANSQNLLKLAEK